MPTVLSNWDNRNIEIREDISLSMCIFICMSREIDTYMSNEEDGGSGQNQMLELQ